MCDGNDSATPKWTLPGYGNSIPVISPTGQGVEWATCEGGLTKRELATFMAMQGLCGRERWYSPKDIAEQAEAIADATIAVLARE